MKNKKTEKKSDNKILLAIKKYRKYIFIASYGICGVFAVIASSNKWPNEALTFIGALLLILSFAVLIRPLLTKEKIDAVEITFIIICSFILIAAVVSYAYNPPKDGEPDKSGVIQIIAAVVGGLITLYGVGLTIKFNRVAKEEDEINKAKPNIFPVGEETWAQLDENTKIQRDLFVRKDLSDFEEAKKTDEGYYFAPLFLANSDLSMCTLKGIGINDKKFVVLHYDNILLKGSNCCFFVDYKFKTDEIINSIQLVLGDMLGNTYSCYVSFYIDEKKNRKKKPIYITSVLETTLMNTSNYPVFEKNNYVNQKKSS